MFATRTETIYQLLDFPRGAELRYNTLHYYGMGLPVTAGGSGLVGEELGRAIYRLPGL